mmetsp:Transcript_28753/g.33035  ORF Transcript_28753/g.33035 Transcript_28753/m.33035 type:complete len:900 (+) Transcript_28753:88-2787(+)
MTNIETDLQKGIPLSIPNDNELYSKSFQATQALISTIESIHQNTTTNTTTDNSNHNAGHTAALLHKATCLILELKQTQRSLGLMVGSNLADQVKGAKMKVESQSLLLQNILYEKIHLMNEIQSCKQVRCQSLLQMAKEEQGLVLLDATADDDDESKNENRSNNNNKNDGSSDKHEKGSDEDAKKKSTENRKEKEREKTVENNLKEEEEEDDTDQNDNEDSIIDSFLAPQTAQSSTNKYSHRDPKKHPYNLAKMHAQLTRRGTLQTELTNANKRKSTSHKDLEKKTKFLKGIPEKINQLERTSYSLQEYFLQESTSLEDSCSNSNTVTASNCSSMMLTGSERRERLKQASELSGPLYTLFVQFQAYLDANRNLTESSTGEKISGWKLNVVDATSNVQENSNDNIDESLALDTENMERVDEGKENEDTFKEKEKQQQRQLEEEEMKKMVQKYTETEAKAIQVWIPVPQNLLSSSSTTIPGRHVKVQFEYLPLLQIVTAHVIHGTAAEKEDQDKKAKASLSQKFIREELLWWKDKQNKDTSSESKSNNNRQLLLLQNLFQNDIGMDLPHGSGVDICFGDDDMIEPNDELMNEDFAPNDIEDEQSNIEGLDDANDNENTVVTSKKEKLLQLIKQCIIHERGQKAYNWCQYLAGLHYPRKLNSNQVKIDPTSKSTIVNLSRRVRSHATLTNLINSLKKSPNSIPIHPSMEGKIQGYDKINSKLEKWSESIDICDDRGLYKCYNAVLKRKSKTLTVCVKIDSRYPAVPPLWSLQPSSSSLITDSLSNQESWSQKHGTIHSLYNIGDTTADEAPPLHDHALGHIESEANTLCNLSMFLNDGLEESYDWILVHQLGFILNGWDSYQQALENGKSTVGNNLTSSGRNRRGRDRRPIGLMGYETFKNGL